MRPDAPRPPVFAAGGAGALLRLPALTRERAHLTHADVDLADTRSTAAYIRRLMGDAAVREAVALSSPALTGQAERVADGGSADARALRRMALSLTRYVLRMATRPTPFGLMAQVAPAAFGEPAAGRVGSAHRRRARPDAAWVSALAAHWETHPAVLPGLRVVASDVCFARGDRWVMPYAAEPNRAGVPRCAEASVRRTDAVCAALDAAARPVPYQEVHERLRAQFPQAPDETVAEMLRRLVAYRMLLTELPPAPDDPDPLGHLLRVLRRLGGGPPEAAGLAAIAADLRAYQAAPPGRGREAAAAVAARMRRLQPQERPLHVDLVADAEVRLPAAVAREAERAADALWRMAPTATAPPYLRRWHEEFLDRYGTGCAVPLLEALAPDAGLGPPDTYRWPPGPGVPWAPAADGPAPRRREALHRLAARALADGAAEVVLTERDIAALAPPGPAAPPAPSMELCFHVLSPSERALAEGEFLLVASPGIGSKSAGALGGRFAHLLGGHPAPEPAAITGPLPVGLVYRPMDPRGGNVLTAPDGLPHRVCVDVFADRGDPGVLGADDLLLAADPHRLRVFSARLGREVVPTVRHLHDPVAAPNAARLLRELGGCGHRHWRPWNWGTLTALPRLPRVRLGRTVLAPAQWHPGDLDPSLADEDAWRDHLQRWRERWRVPDRVSVGRVDHRIELDLTVPLHRHLLRDELRRHPGRGVYESPDAAGPPCGWLRGADGTYLGELVVPLTDRGRGAGQPPRSGSPPRRTRRAHPPGGPWLYAKLYCSPARQDTLLTAHLPGLLARLPAEVDRWFFLRYRDPAPHLRLRFHGEPAALNGVLLPALHDWASGLRAQRLAGRLTLDTYEPETERYGGPGAITAAERAFHADSEAVLAQLALVRAGRLAVDPLLLAAANHLDIARHACPAPAWPAWLLTAYPKHHGHHRAFQSRRREAVRLWPSLDGAGPAGLADTPAGTEVLRAFARRAPALRAYRAAAGDRTAVRGLLHLHHNRLLGPGPDEEERGYAVARGIVQTHRDRERHAPR